MTASFKLQRKDGTYTATRYMTIREKTGRPTTKHCRSGRKARACPQNLEALSSPLVRFCSICCHHRIHHARRANRDQRVSRTSVARLRRARPCEQRRCLRRVRASQSSWRLCGVSLKRGGHSDACAPTFRQKNAVSSTILHKRTANSTELNL